MLVSVCPSASSCLGKNNIERNVAAVRLVESIYTFIVQLVGAAAGHIPPPVGHISHAW